MTRDLGTGALRAHFGLEDGPFRYELLEGETPFEGEGSARFVPLPVERPGGGRITDKRDPAPADLRKIDGEELHRLAALALEAMQKAAWADGIPTSFLRAVSGYRSSKRQARLYANAVAKYGPSEARKWVAPPGHSAHQSGRAVDLSMGSSNGKKNVAVQRKTAAYRWLVARAAEFGFYPYEREPWHWEYNPPAAGSALAPRVAQPVPVVASVSGVPRLLRQEDGTGPGKTLYVKIDLKVPENAAWTGIFVPEGFRAAGAVDVVLLLHGFYESRVDRYWHGHNPPLPLREAFAQSGKNALLVIPTLGPRSQSGRLTKPGQLDAFLALVLAAAGQYALSGRSVELGQLVLAAHSGGGRVMAGLALGGDAALAKLRECWAFDSFYGSTATEQWSEWARRNPEKRLIAHAATGLVPRGSHKVHGPRSVVRDLEPKAFPNVELHVDAADGHYGALSKHFEERMRAASYLAQR